MLMAVCGVAQAQCLAEIKNIQISDKDYIWIEIEYEINGVKLKSSYPMDFQNVIGKTDEEIIKWIDSNINYQCERHIEADFRKKENLKVIKNKLISLIGKKYTKETADLLFDLNRDGINDIKLTVKTDGTYVENIINP